MSRFSPAMLPPSQPVRRPTALPLPIVWFGRGMVAIAMLGVLIAAGRGLWMWANHARTALEFPYSLNYGEGPLLDQVVRVAAGDALYDPDLSTPPYTINNYPPLYTLIQVPFYQVNGAAFWYGRAISLISAAVAALFLGLTARAVTRDSLAGLCAGLALLTIPYIFFWSALARIDTLALALSMIGLWLAAQFTTSTRAILLAALFFTAAAFTRQTYLLAAPLAAFYWLWANRERFRALLLVVTIGALTLTAFAVLLVASRGGIFFHLITANLNLHDRTILDHYIVEISQYLPVLLIGAGLFFVLGGLIKSQVGSTKSWWLFAPYLAGGLLTALTISKVGSDVNYLYELSAALCLTAAGMIATVKRVPPLRAMLVLVLGVQMLIAGDLSATHYAPIVLERAAQIQAFDQLYAAISGVNGNVITDEHMGILVLAGKPVMIQPFEMTQLALAGVWDQTPFLDALERGDYGFLALYQPYRNPNLRRERWSMAMLRTINNHFRVGLRLGETTLYTYVP